MSFSFGTSNTSLRAWVRERFVPLVMVVASDGVESICQEKNGLHFVDLLRPFGEQHEVNAPLRVAGNSVRVTEARLRFSYAYTMEQPTAEAIDTHLREVVEKISEEMVKQVPHRLSEGPLNSAPWFLKYRQDFLRLQCFDTHETIDHPLGCIYAISSTEVDSVKAFEDLMQNTTLPSLMLQEYMTPVSQDDCGKLFVIVHDGSREGQTGLELAREKVRIVQKEFGHDHCVLLLINTSGGKEEMRGTPPVAFDDLRPCAVPGGGAGEHNSDLARPKEGWGCFLSKADLDRVNELVRNYMTRCFFPKLDIRIGRLRASVSLKRRSIAGKLVERTSTLLKSSLSSIGRDSSSFGFKYYSDEAQLRQLGDILFLLGRYEDALEVFSAISISKEAFPKFYAGIQFMVGLGYAVLVGCADPSIYFTRAYDYYQRTPGKVSLMFATRTAMVHSAYCLSEGQISQAAQALLKCYEREEMLRGALLLEEAAILLLKTQPPCQRKFAFQMTLAGVRFYNCQFHKLSLRCYHLILDIYTSRQWLIIEQHVASMMLKFHLEQGNNADAFTWTIHMLTSQHALAPELQKEYIQWICSYIKEVPSHEVSSIADFNLPILHLETMEVRFDGEVVYGTVMAEEAEQGTWTDLESRFADPFSASTTTGLALGNNHVEEPYGWVVCGEAVRFSCEFENPLQTPIEVTSAQLLFEFERTDDSCCPASRPVSVPERSFSLNESEKATLQLQLIPNTPGRLRIIGVSWYLNERIPGHKLFGKVSWQGESHLPFRARSHYPTLLFVALEPVPRLLLTSAPVPERLRKGELWKSTWRFKSVGKIGVRDLQITSSCTNLKFSPSPHAAPNEELFWKKGVYQMECETTEGLELNLCLNPQTTGMVDIHTVFRYENPQSETPLRVRFLRHSFSVEVIEALHMQSWLMPSELSQTFVLAMALENHLHDAIFDITSIKAKPSHYQIQCPDSETREFQLQILPGQKLLQHVLVSKSDIKDEVHLPNGTATAERSSSSSEGEGMHRAVAGEAGPVLGISLHWRSTEHSSEISVVEEGKDTESESLFHEGCLVSSHDVTSLATKVDLTLDQCRVTQTIQNGFVSFPITIRLQNISHEPLSISFTAGEDWICAESVGWKQQVMMDKEQEQLQDTGLSPMPSWNWSGQTERHIPYLKPAETTELHTEIVCFFPGSFCVVNYCCKWKSLDNPTLSGTIPGKPLYITVLEAVPLPVKKGTSVIEN